MASNIITSNSRFLPIQNAVSLRARISDLSDKISGLVQNMAQCRQAMHKNEQQLIMLRANLPSKNEHNSLIANAIERYQFRKQVQKLPEKFIIEIQRLEARQKELTQLVNNYDKELHEAGQLRYELEKTQQELQRYEEERERAALASSPSLAPKEAVPSTPEAAPTERPSVGEMLLDGFVLTAAVLIEGACSLMNLMLDDDDEPVSPITKQIPAVNTSRSPSPLSATPSSSSSSASAQSSPVSSSPLSAPSTPGSSPSASPIPLSPPATPKSPKDQVMDFFRVMPNFRSNPGIGEIFAALPDTIQVTMDPEDPNKMTITMPKMTGQLAKGEMISHEEHLRLERYTDGKRLSEIRDKDAPNPSARPKESGPVPLTNCKYFRSINKAVWDRIKGGSKFEIGPRLVLKRKGDCIEFCDNTGPRTTDGSILMKSMKLKENFESEKGCVEVTATGKLGFISTTISADFFVNDIQALLPKLQRV